MCQKVEASGFEFTNLVFSVSFPPQLSVREHAAWLLVKQEMGKQSLSLGRDDIVQLKEAYKWITHPLFSEELGVPIDGKSLFEVSVVFAHPETVEDCHFLRAICPECFKPAKNKQSVFTRMAVMKALNKIKKRISASSFLVLQTHQRLYALFLKLNVLMVLFLWLGDIINTPGIYHKLLG